MIFTRPKTAQSHSCLQTSTTTITGSGVLGSDVEIANAALIIDMGTQSASTTGALTIWATGELAFTNVNLLSNALSVGTQFSIFTGKVGCPKSPFPALNLPPKKSEAVSLRGTACIMGAGLSSVRIWISGRVRAQHDQFGNCGLCLLPHCLWP